ncbi:MAG: B12-binding domain-containing radical SAM protein [Syntrophales bacterium]|nr:B12-binding domain-containing radical SAM protein [Syntrophales bacterium]
MKALLVYPEYTTTFWSFKYALEFISKKAAYPPLGLMTIAALLPAEWEKKLIDMNTSSLSDDDILWADYVFISAMIIQAKSARKVIERCRTLGKPIVAGGPLFTAHYEEYPEVNHFVLNEGEITLPPFLADLEAGVPKRIYRANGWADMEKSPVPLHGLIDIKKYGAMNIQFSRGCPFDCEFCDITVLFGRVPRTKTSAQIIRELESIYETGWRGGVFFVDDNFIGNKKRLKIEILPALQSWMDKKNHPFKFYTEASINLADDSELMEQMVKAGFDTVFIGLETPHEESLRECNKIHNVNRNLMESIKRIQKHGLEVQAGFILGFDHDPPTIFDRLIEFVNNTGIVTAMVGLLNAPYGTRLYERLKREGRIISKTTGDNTDFSTNILPKMKMEHLIQGYEKVVRTLYAPKVYYTRVLKFLREYNPPQKKVFILRIEHFKALLRSIIVLGIKGRERWHYWKGFIWTLLKKPKIFPLYITYAIYGYHFRRVFERVKTGDERIRSR